MKWWKRLLRRRRKWALGLNELQRVFRLGQAVFRIFSVILVLSKALQRKDAKIMLRMFGRILSKRY